MSQEKYTLINELNDSVLTNFQLSAYKDSIDKVVIPSSIGTILKKDIKDADSIIVKHKEYGNFTIKNISSIISDSIYIPYNYISLNEAIITQKITKQIGITTTKGQGLIIQLPCVYLNRIKIDSTIIEKRITSINFYYKNDKTYNVTNNSAELNVWVLQSDDINKGEYDKFIKNVHLSEDAKNKKGWISIDLSDYDIYVEDYKYLYFGFENLSQNFSTKHVGSRRSKKKKITTWSQLSQNVQGEKWIRDWVLHGLTPPIYLEIK